MTSRFYPGYPPSKHDKNLSGHWFVFGYHPDDTIDLSDGDQDIITHCPKEIAYQIIKARQDFLDELEKIYLSLPPSNG